MGDLWYNFEKKVKKLASRKKDTHQREYRIKCRCVQRKGNSKFMCLNT